MIFNDANGKLITTAFIECPQCPEILSPSVAECKCGWKQWSEERFIMNGIFGKARMPFKKEVRAHTDEQLYEFARDELKILNATQSALTNELLNPGIKEKCTIMSRNMRDGPSGVGLAILKPPAICHVQEFIDNAYAESSTTIWNPSFYVVQLRKNEVRTLYAKAIEHMRPEQAAEFEKMMICGYVVIMKAQLELTKYEGFKARMRGLRAEWSPCKRQLDLTEQSPSKRKRTSDMDDQMLKEEGGDEEERSEQEQEMYKYRKYSKKENGEGEGETCEVNNLQAENVSDNQVESNEEKVKEQTPQVLKFDRTLHCSDSMDEARAELAILDDAIGRAHYYDSEHDEFVCEGNRIFLVSKRNLSNW